MKNKFVLSVVLLLGVLFLSACSGVATAAQGVVELPSPLQAAILAGVTFVVGVVVLKITELYKPIGDFLGQYADEVSMAVAGALTLTVQNWLNAIPPEWEGVANAALALLVAVLAAVGLIKTFRRAKVLGFK